MPFDARIERIASDRSVQVVERLQFHFPDPVVLKIVRLTFPILFPESFGPEFYEHDAERLLDEAKVRNERYTPIRDKLLRILMTGPKTETKLCEGLGIHDIKIDNISDVLDDMRKEGIVLRFRVNPKVENGDSRNAIFYYCLAKARRIRSQYIQALREEGLTIAEIAQNLGLTYPDVAEIIRLQGDE